MQRLKDRFVRLASEPEDTPELKLRKSIGVAVGIISIPTWLAYSLIYFAGGAQLAGQLALLTACATLLLSLAYIRFRHQALYWVVPMAMAQLAFLAIHFALGGFTSSIYLLVYVLLPVFLTPVAEDPRHTKYWFASSVVLVLVAGVGESFISHGNSLSPLALTALTVSIILGFGAYALLPALIYGQRSKLIEQQMAAEREAHLAQTQQALARQTATADMLRVISSSPTDVQPVFDAIVNSAVSLIDCDGAFVVRAQGGHFALAALVDAAGEREDMSGALLPIDAAANFPSRVLVDKATLHIPDWSAINLPSGEQRAYDTRGARASLMLPLLRQGECIGVLGMMRQRAGAFSDNEIGLAESFRDQALIAIQNAQLFNDTQEALERQTATTEVLQVINASPGDLDPVFDAVVGKAVQLCEADWGGLWLVDGDTARPTRGGRKNFPTAFADWVAETAMPVQQLLGNVPTQLNTDKELARCTDKSHQSKSARTHKTN